MKVIDHERGGWYLFQDEERIYLDGNYSHRAIEYDHLIELSKEEVQAFRQGGRDYITRLVHEINESAPILKLSDSAYKNRRIIGEIRERTTEAVREWNKVQPKGELDDV